MERRTLLVFQLTLALQCFGLAAIAWLDGLKSASYLFLNTELNETLVIWYNNALASLLVLIGLTSLWRLKEWKLVTVGVIFFLEALTTVILGGGFGTDYALFSQSLRYAWPLILAWSIMVAHRRKLDRQAPWLIKGFCFITGLTFIAHGFEAIFHHPTFIDYIIVAIQKVLPNAATESLARYTLYLIGIIDIGVGLIILWWPKGNILLYMMFWGAVTAASRVVYSEWLGLPDLLLRTAHWGVPLAVYLMQQGPIRSVFRTQFKGSAKAQKALG